jgi:hypothetical protein
VPPSPETIQEFVINNGPGPNLEDLHLDIRGGLGSDWNKKAFYLLQVAFCAELEALSDVPTRSSQYYLDLITEQFSRLVTIWNNAQPKRKADGTLENFEEVEDRMNGLKNKQLVGNRHTIRRFTVSAFLYCFVGATLNMNAFEEIQS